MSTENAAAVTMNRINRVFALYEAKLCKVLRDETVPQYRREELAQEGVLIEENFRKCRALYEADAERFVDVYGEVHSMSDADILTNFLFRGGKL